MHALEMCVFSVGFSFGYQDIYIYIFKIMLYVLLKSSLYILQISF